MVDEEHEGGNYVMANYKDKIDLSKPRKCKSCLATIYWIKTHAGKAMPVDPDGLSHYGTCPDADKWRKK